MICTEWDVLEAGQREQAIAQRHGWLALPGTLTGEFGQLDAGTAERGLCVSTGKWMKASTIVDEDT